MDNKKVDHSLIYGPHVVSKDKGKWHHDAAQGYPQLLKVDLQVLETVEEKSLKFTSSKYRYDLMAYLEQGEKVSRNLSERHGMLRLFWFFVACHVWAVTSLYWQYCACQMYAKHKFCDWKHWKHAQIFLWGMLMVGECIEVLLLKAPVRGDTEWLSKLNCRPVRYKVDSS